MILENKNVEYTLNIIQDEFSESPDRWENNDIFLVYDHRQFNVKRENFDPHSIFTHLEAKRQIEKSEITLNGKSTVEEYSEDLNPEYDKYWIFGVDAYIHSGINLSLSNTKDYPDRKWDVSTTGYILVRKTFNPSGKNFENNEEEAENYAEGLIETWNKFLSGDVWGYEIVKSIKCKCCGNTEETVEDSCWGFYGENECKEEGELILKNYK